MTFSKYKKIYNVQDELSVLGEQESVPRRIKENEDSLS